MCVCVCQCVCACVCVSVCPYLVQSGVVLLRLVQILLRLVWSSQKTFKKQKALISGRQGCGRDVQNSKKLLKT